ncbi:hypothetical protein [Hydrogenophaga sp.]|uniref:hypothetical protein n=1 Tax=Hydrogenophaga sp. TaxID=1904254 RepID=UPI003D09A66B
MNQSHTELAAQEKLRKLAVKCGGNPIDEKVVMLPEDLARFAAALESPERVQGEANQCDGCAVGAPINEWGNHKYPDGSLIACSRDRYTTEAPAQADRSEKIPLLSSAPAQDAQERLALLKKQSDGSGSLAAMQAYINGLEHELVAALRASTPESVPLSEAQIANLMPADDTPMSLGEAFVRFARAVERAHGIVTKESST